MKFTEEELNNLSNLARITIAPEEKTKMLTDMQAILGYISEINSVEGTLIEGDDELFNVVRDDVITRSSGEASKRLLDEAPAVKDGYVQVKQVLK